MNIVSKRVLASAGLIVAYACATPVNISGDVQIADPGDFGDAGVFAGAGGGASAGSGGSVGGGAGGVAQAGTGGAPVASSGGSLGLGGRAGTGTGGTPPVGAGGVAPLAGAGGSPSGGSSSGGAPATTGGSGGEVGSAGTSAAAGTGSVGDEPVFAAASCDFDDLSGCEDLTCEQVCPTNDGGSCVTRCEPVVDCVATNAACVTEADPLCGRRNQGAPNVCTTVVEPAGGPDTTQATQPAFVARQLVECLCSTPRPQ